MILSVQLDQFQTAEGHRRVAMERVLQHVLIMQVEDVPGVLIVVQVVVRIHVIIYVQHLVLIIAMENAQHRVVESVHM